MNSNFLKKITALALTGLFLVSTGAIAAGAKTKADCEKAGGTWDAKTKKCTMPKPQ